MPEVKYLLIDMNYYLFRARFALGAKREFTSGELLGSVLLTINKLIKATGAGKVLFSWDKSPYIKLQGIETYKTNRVTEQDKITEVKNRLDSEGLTDEEVSQLKIQLANLEIAERNFKTTQSVKYSLINKSDSFGFINLMKQGIESDDWGYFFSKFLTEETNSLGVVASSDDDWQWNITKNCYWFNSRKGNFKLVSYDEQLEKLSKVAINLGIPIFEYGQLLACYYGNHNNVLPNEEFQKSCSFEDFLNLYSEGKLNTTPLNNIFNALNINNLYPTFKMNIWESIYNSPDGDYKSYWNYHREQDIKIFPNIVKSILNKLDKKLYGFTGLTSGA